MDAKSPRADTDREMTCCTCAMTIWTCASCEGACSIPVCAECLDLGIADPHERMVVALPELDASASSYDWIG